MKRCLLAMLASMLFTTDATGQQPRDNLRRAVTGTSTITGVVLSAEAQARPLRRARVMISGSELDLSRSTITTDDGRFTFDALPAGRYTVSVSKDGYASLAFGAVRPDRPGQLVTLRAGEVRQVRMQLPRGAVITGILRDPQGDPAPGFAVVLLSRRFAPATGEQRLQVVPNTNAVTDDRGIYRVFGLPAGSYVVTAQPRFPGVQGDIVAASRGETQRALAEVRERRTSSRPGMPAPAPPAPPAAPPKGGLSFAPTYYPGTTLESRATVVTVAAGEVRTGVDFDFDYVPTVSVEGFITVPQGARVQMILSKADPDSPYQTTTSTSPGQDGRFMFRRVQPGHYVIHARAFSVDSNRPAPVQLTLWGRTEIVVAGEDIEGVGVVLEPSLTLAGELVFEGASTASPSLNGFKLPMQVASRGMASAPFPAAVVEGSQIVLRGVVPGLYRFISSPQGIRTRVGPWWLKSILMDDREVLDQPLEILPNTKSMRVTFSDQASQLSGVVVDREGTPVTDTHVVVFSENPKSWFQHSRRVAAVLLNEEGRYTVSNLPAGNYFVAVSSDLENNEWFDPEKLQTLSAGAGRVTIVENESVTRNITMGPRQP